jgi:hypothetical protein
MTAQRYASSQVKRQDSRLPCGFGGVNLTNERNLHIVIQASRARLPSLLRGAFGIDKQ